MLNFTIKSGIGEKKFKKIQKKKNFILFFYQSILELKNMGSSQLDFFWAICKTVMKDSSIRPQMRLNVLASLILARAWVAQRTDSLPFPISERLPAGQLK